MFNPSFPPGWWYYFRSCDVAELNDDIIDVMVQYGEQIDSPISALGVWQVGGAVSRVGEDDTAFNGRAVGHTFNIGGNTMTADGFEEEREWVHRFWTGLQPYHTSVYVNFLMDEGRERVRQAYGSAKYDRLRTLKQKYDPSNFFRMNQNIPPA
jgi:FAD/FMN-containing dehydrogenase